MDSDQPHDALHKPTTSLLDSSTDALEEQPPIHIVSVWILPDENTKKIIDDLDKKVVKLPSKRPASEPHVTVLGPSVVDDLDKFVQKVKDIANMTTLETVSPLQCDKGEIFARDVLASTTDYPKWLEQLHYDIVDGAAAVGARADHPLARKPGAMAGGWDFVREEYTPHLTLAYHVPYREFDKMLDLVDATAPDLKLPAEGVWVMKKGDNGWVRHEFCPFA